MTRLIPLLFGLSACAPSVIAAYEADRDSALADPGPALAQWEPDAVITLTEAVVDEALSASLSVHGQVEHTIDAGMLRAEPKLTVRSVELRPGRCDRCSEVRAILGGKLAVHTPLGTVRVPAEATLDFDAVFEVEAGPETWTLMLDTRKIRGIELNLGGTNMGALADPVRDWIEAALRDGGPTPLADLGSSNLPIRAIRVLPREGHLRLELLTDTPSTVAITDPDGIPRNGWRLDLSTDALYDIARAASHREGPVARDIVAVPTSLDLREDRFVLGLRLWRIKGRGWWRDYTVRGSLSVEDGRIALTPESVEDEAHSQGAAWVDPLAALGQGVILKTLERALETSVPGTHRTKGDDLRVVVHIEEIEGRGAVVVATGSLDVKAPKKR